MVNVTIDGKSIQVPEGTTVLRAAESAGIKIPTLCDHPQLTPYGGCRLCLVEIEGARTLQPSCTLPITPNMVVKTDTEKVKEARKFVLTLIFSERNHFCMYCQVSGGDCDLQNAAYDEGMTHWPLQPNYTTFTVDASNPYFVIDNNRCILCRRCVRACAELVGNFTLGIEDRGANSYLAADLGTPIGESTCISCGTCVQVCPTGAIIDRQSAYYGRDKDVTHVKSICTQCSIGCGIDVVTRDNRVVRIDGDWEAPINNGLLCSLGRFDPLENDRERVATSMVRKDLGLKASTRADAIKAAADLLKTALKDGSSVGALISTKASAETLSLFNKFFGGIKNVEFGPLDSVGYNRATSSMLPIMKESSIDQIDQADCIVVIGADLVKDHQVAGFLVKRNLPRGVKLVLFDNKTNELTSFADAVIDPSKDLGSAIEGFEQSLSSAKPDQATEAGKAASFVKSADKVMLIVGELPSDVLPDRMTAFLKSLKSNAKSLEAITLKGQANSYASYLLGMDKSVELKGLNTLFVFQGDEEIDQKLTRELENIPNLVIQSTFVSGLTSKACVVLPSTSWSESEGTFISLDGRIQTALQIVTPSQEISSIGDTLMELAEAASVKVDSNWRSGINKARIVTSEPIN
jgi:formate dehydrogenase major subunit